MLSILNSIIFTGYTGCSGKGDCPVWGPVWGSVWGPVAVVGGGGGAAAANYCRYSFKTEEVEGPRSGSSNWVSSKSAGGGSGCTYIIVY